MSGHSKWHSIKHKKGAADAKRGKIFTKHAKLIYIAARTGGADPNMNPSLRAAIINAKADNLPNSNIDKALKKAVGDKDGAQMEELMYECFGPVGTALYVEVITDNKNRSAASVKTTCSKNGGNMGSAGSVGWMFERRGVVSAKSKLEDAEEAELMAIDAGALDVSFDDEFFEIITEAVDLMNVRDKLENSGFEIDKAEISYIPKELVKIDSLEDAKKIIRLIDLIEEDEDVSNVYSNFDIPDEILEQIN